VLAHGDAAVRQVAQGLGSAGRVGSISLRDRLDASQQGTMIYRKTANIRAVQAAIRPLFQGS